jgi:hypothetical protein
MAITEFSGTPPNLNQSQPDFDTNNQAFVNYVTGLAPELNEFVAALNTFATTSTSSTSLAVSIGTKNLTVEAGKSFQIGMTVTLGYTTNGAIFMQGQVTAYNSTTGAMTVLVNFIQGSGTYAAWTVSLSNPVLANDWSETVAAHATTMAIWTSGAKVINGSGTATITDFPDAPQAGAMREIRFEAGTVLTDNANISVMGNANYTIQAGDVVYLTALTTTTFDAVIAKEDGTPVSFNFANAATLNAGTDQTRPLNSKIVRENAWVYGSSVATTSGASVQIIAGLPSWVTEVEILFAGVSLNGTNNFFVRMNEVNTGYLSGSTRGSSAISSASSTDGFIVTQNDASWAHYGVMRLSKGAGSTWYETHSLHRPQGTDGGQAWGAGYINLGGALTSLRITSGSNFDSGSITVRYR